MQGYFARHAARAFGSPPHWIDLEYPALRNLEKHVLVVDDYNTMRRILRNLLSQIGFSNVEEAEDGSTGLRKLRERSFGLVISDWNMAPMSGLEFLKEVRSDGALKDMPFIMITAESKTENVVAAKEAGVSNYIVKPFNADTLKKKIEAVLGEL
jgi:two-component system, chemotaxis family, chemotaxis protein CheY